MIYHIDDYLLDGRQYIDDESLAETAVWKKCQLPEVLSLDFHCPVMLGGLLECGPECRWYVKPECPDVTGEAIIL